MGIGYFINAQWRSMVALLYLPWIRVASSQIILFSFKNNGPVKLQIPTWNWFGFQLLHVPVGRGAEWGREVRVLCQVVHLILPSYLPPGTRNIWAALFLFCFILWGPKRLEYGIWYNPWRISHLPRAYGAVYKSMHKESGQLLAIKQVPVDSDLQDIIKEISIMQQCDRSAYPTSSLRTHTHTQTHTLLTLYDCTVFLFTQTVQVGS